MIRKNLWSGYVQLTHSYFLSFYRFSNPFKLLLRSSLRQANRLCVLFELIIMSG
jgi:hypothetical protein